MSGTCCCCGGERHVKGNLTLNCRCGAWPAKSDGVVELAAPAEGVLHDKDRFGVVGAPAEGAAHDKANVSPALEPRPSAAGL